MTTRYVLACVAFSVGVMGNVFATGYSDDILDSSDASVKRLVDGRSLIYVFTQPSTEVSVTFKTAATLDRALVVGGGGAGGAVMGGGGGGGGVIAVSTPVSLAADANVTLTVGAGGVAPTANTAGSNATLQPGGRPGENSTLVVGGTTYTALGGGGGSGWSETGVNNSSGNGCGGGGCNGHGSSMGTSGQGFDGAAGSNGTGGGGGGAGGAGVAATASANATGNRGIAGKGGDGLASDITGETLYYGAGGGGGCGWVETQLPGAGGKSGDGTGIWGNGASWRQSPGTPKGAQPGQSGFGGGGGGGTWYGGNNVGNTAGAGGSGTVILRVQVSSAKVLLVENGSRMGTGTVSPAYGNYIGARVLTATDATDDVRKTRAVCTGYTLETWDETVGDWGTPVAYEGTSYSYDGSTDLRLAWQWSVEPTVDWVSVGDDGEVAVKVDNTEATTLAGWLSAKGITDLSPFDAVWFAGTADVTATTELNAWKKVVRVKSGARVIAANGNALGTTAESETYVEAGGQVVLHSEAQNGTKLRNKMTYIAGTGPDGKGALYSTEPGTSTANIWPAKITLTDDAKVSWKNANQDLNGITWDLNGHDLNLCSRDNSYDRCGAGSYFNDSSAADNGRVIVDYSILFEGANTFQASGTHELVFRTDGIYRTNGGQGYGATGEWTNHWKMVIAGPKGGSYPPGFNAGINRNGWRAPVEINAPTWFTRQNNYSSQTFFGPVSGDYGFGDARRDSVCWLRLANPNNTFKGGVYLTSGSYLSPQVNGALPAFDDSGVVTLENGCTVWLNRGISYALPDLKLTGTSSTYQGMVHGEATGAWRTVIKADAADMVWRSSVGARVLDLQKGVFRIPSPLAGLYEGFTNVNNVTAADRATATNDVQMLPLAMQFDGNVCYLSERGTAGFYTGYLWNRGTTDVTWRFAVSYSTTDYRLYIDGNEVLKPTQTATPTFASYTLTPGAHLFEMRYTGKTSQGTKVGTLYPWSNQYQGWGVDTQNRGRTNTTDYVLLKDTGIGSVFTLAKTIDELPAACRQTMPVFETLVATNTAATFDLCGNSIAVPNVVGAPQVANQSPDLPAGTFTVGETWTVATKAVTVNKKTVRQPVGTARIAGALVFAEGATVEVPADLAHGTYDLVTADSINRCPKSANEKWCTQLSADGKTVQLVWGVGLKVFIR